MKIKNYNEWISESAEFNKTMNSVMSTRLIVENLLKKKCFSDDELLCLYVLRESDCSLYDFEEHMLDEGKFLQRIQGIGQKLVDKGKESINDLKELVGKELTGVPEFFKALSGGLKNLVKFVGDFIQNVYKLMFSKPVEWVKSTLGSKYNEFEKKIIETAKKDESKLVSEAKSLSELVLATRKILSPDSIMKKLDAAFIKSDTSNLEMLDLAIVEESMRTSILLAISEAIELHTKEEIMEGFIALDEGHDHTKIPFITTITNVLQKFPPFSWLHNLEDFISKNTNKALTHISEVFDEKGFVKESVEFAIIGTLVGFAVGTIIELNIKHTIVHFFPPIHSLMIVLGAIASGICVTHVASTVIDGLQLDTQQQHH